MKRLTREPVTLATLLPIVLWAASVLGFDVDEETATYLAGGLLVVLGLLARWEVTPVADPKDRDGHPLIPVEASAVPPSLRPYLTGQAPPPEPPPE